MTIETRITKIGLPVLRQETYDSFMAQVKDIGTYEDQIKFLEELFKQISERDSLYALFIQGASNLYPQRIRDMACGDLILGYELLRMEGDLPLLDKEKFERRYNATMNRSLAILNVGHNMGIIERDNPVFARFIKESSVHYGDKPKMMEITSDLSSGYMFLADNVKRG